MIEQTLSRRCGQARKVARECGEFAFFERSGGRRQDFGVEIEQNVPGCWGHRDQTFDRNGIVEGDHPFERLGREITRFGALENLKLQHLVDANASDRTPR
ncbi:MAG: hypothetical protein MUF06_24905 [Pirellulaceae bacterium]|nr:hypothetical protein [Pirellulaceae bacterium]